MFSSRFYKLNPSEDASIKTQLTTEGKIFPYGKSTDQLGTEEDLEIKIDSIGSNDYGKIIKLLVDDEIPQWDRRRGEFNIRYTKRVNVEIFEKEPISNFISVCGFKKADSLLRQALIKNVSKSPFKSVDILLKEKQSEIESRFPNVKLFKVREIKDDHVKTAMLTGSYMEDSPEYRKFVQDPVSAGEILYIGVPIHDKLVFITQNGSIYSRNVFAPEEELREVFEIMKTLMEINAVKVS